MYLYIKILYGINVESGEATRTDISHTDKSIQSAATSTTSGYGHNKLTSSTPMTPQIEMQDRISVLSTSAMSDNELNGTIQTPSTTTYPDGELGEERKLKAAKPSVTVTLEQAQLKMVRNITKNTLLGLFGLLSTVVINIKTSVEWIADLRTDATMWRCMASFDGAVNIIVMYLIFGWTAVQYGKICIYCHTGMMKCCVWATKKSIIRKDKAENGMPEYVD